MENTNGYIWLYRPDHPLSMSNGMIYEHRLVACDIFGVDEVRDKHVHHKDENPKNNNPDNLELLEVSDHHRKHRPPTMMVCDGCGNEVRKLKRKKYCSTECAGQYKTKIDWPEPEEVRQMVEDTNYSATGRALGVSDNAVRKYLKRTTRG